jgi:hypothetical protein
MKIPALFLIFLYFVQNLEGQISKQDSSSQSNIFSAMLSPAAPSASAILDSSEISMLKEGDFLLRKGFGWISDKIAEILNEEIPVTHCGLILSEGYEELHILHAISNQDVDGVHIEPLRQYLKDSKSGSLVAIRLKADDFQIKSVINESLNLYAQKIPFDLAFNDADSSKMYCAELFACVFKKVFQKDILPEKISFMGLNAIRMRNFLNPLHFDILFSQFGR